MLAETLPCVYETLLARFPQAALVAHDARKTSVRCKMSEANLVTRYAGTGPAGLAREDPNEVRIRALKTWQACEQERQRHRVDFERGLIRSEVATMKNKAGRVLRFDAIPASAGY